MKLIAVTGTRADFGLWLPVLREIGRRGRADARVELLVTGMHLDPRFGSTVREVRAAGFPIAAEVAASPEGDGRADMAAGLGTTLASLAPVLEDAAPDWLLLLGDRGEQLAAGLAALHLGIAVAHLHGGERTLGAVDDAFRDMITRLAHIHLVADASSAERLRRLGEAPWRITVTGAPGLDDLAHVDAAAVSAVGERFGVADEPYAVVIVHPETVGRADPRGLLDAVLDAVAEAGLPAVAILPNADAGGRGIRETLLARASELRGVEASLPRDEYVALVAGASVLIGNSSSGIIEAPLLGVPAVNVGDRQRGRLRGDNVIDVAPDRVAIRDAIATATSPAFRERLSRTSPYGTGRAAPRIVDAILEQPIDDRLLVKEVA